MTSGTYFLCFLTNITDVKIVKREGASGACVLLLIKKISYAYLRHIRGKVPTFIALDISNALWVALTYVTINHPIEFQIKVWKVDRYILNFFISYNLRLLKGHSHKKVVNFNSSQCTINVFLIIKQNTHVIWRVIREIQSSTALLCKQMLSH